MNKIDLLRRPTLLILLAGSSFAANDLLLRVDPSVVRDQRGTVLERRGDDQHVGGIVQTGKAHRSADDRDGEVSDLESRDGRGLLQPRRPSPGAEGQRFRGSYGPTAVAPASAARWMTSRSVVTSGTPSCAATHT